MPSSCSPSTTTSGSACVRQYRHPATGTFLELPAGLRDSDGEDPLETAERELLEEVELRGGEWRELFALWPSAGISAERHVFYLARGLRPRDRGDFALEHEEAEMEMLWVRRRRPRRRGARRPGHRGADRGGRAGVRRAAAAGPAVTHVRSVNHAGERHGPAGASTRSSTVTTTCSGRCATICGYDFDAVDVACGRTAASTPTCRGCARAVWAPSSGRSTCPRRWATSQSPRPWSRSMRRTSWSSGTPTGWRWRPRPTRWRLPGRRGGSPR